MFVTTSIMFLRSDIVQNKNWLQFLNSTLICTTYGDVIFHRNILKYFSVLAGHIAILKKQLHEYFIAVDRRCEEEHLDQ